MSREIKFRAWFYDGDDLSSGEMVGLQEAVREGYVDFKAHSIAPFDECTILMQYTGLKDKNGVEIYEGDVVGYREPGMVKGHLIKYKVVYGSGAFVLEPLDPGNEYEAITLSVEVIGNIYQSPELLNAKQEEGE